MPHELTHTVQQRENLTTISRQYGFSNPGPIVFYPKNRNTFKDNKKYVIKPGQQITIPWSTVRLKDYIDAVGRLIAKSEADFRKDLAKLLQNKTEIERIEMQGDVAAFLLTMGVGLTNMAVQGAKGATMTNKEAVKYLLTSRAANAHSIASLVVKPTKGGRLWKFAKRTALGFLSPSYYSSLYIAYKENDFDIAAEGTGVVVDKLARNVIAVQKDMVVRLKRRKAEAQQQLSGRYYQKRI